MKKPLPVGGEFFGKIRTNHYFYVDKTLFQKRLQSPLQGWVLTNIPEVFSHISRSE